ncbi:hypothetical protein ACFSHQ_15460 [Gemmobacter lanyuensis]
MAEMLADQALIHLPYGGIYLIGGMSLAMAPHFATFGLEAQFRKPRRIPLLQGNSPSPWWPTITRP